MRENARREEYELEEKEEGDYIKEEKGEGGGGGGKVGE